MPCAMRRHLVRCSKNRKANAFQASWTAKSIPCEGTFSAILTMTNTPLNLTAQFRRRLYVALVVALATFLLAIAGVGLVCHGYDFSPSAKNLRSGAGEQVRVAGRKLDEQLHSAVESASKDLVEAEAALANFATQHFKQWPALLERASNSHNVRNSPAVSANNSRETQPLQMMANPSWQELRNQLDKL